LEQLKLIKQRFNLDFDNTHAITIEKFDSIAVSFDSNFDKTYLGRKTPNDLI
jgi:predicted nucleic acid-binding protein